MLLWIRRNTKRALVLAMAPGFVALSIDAAIGHFAGKNFDNKLQFIPVVFGVVSFLALGLVGLIRLAPTPRAVTLRVVGLLAIGVGVAGTYFHLTAFLRELKGDHSWSAIEGALSVAPPMLAPLSFAGIGALLWLLASPRLLMRLRVGRPTASAAQVKELQEARREPPKAAAG